MTSVCFFATLVNDNGKHKNIGAQFYFVNNYKTGVVLPIVLQEDHLDTEVLYYISAAASDTEAVTTKW